MSWVIFSFDLLGDGINYIKILWGQAGLNLYNGDGLYLLYTNAFLLIILILASTDIPKRIWSYLELKIKANIIFTVETILLLLIMVISIAYLVDQSYNPFLYFRF